MVDLDLPGEPLRIPLVDRRGQLCAGASVPRLELDALLVEEAVLSGVDIRQEVNIRSFSNDKGVSTVQGIGKDGEVIRETAKLVLAADGSNSVLARQLGLVRPVPRLARIGFVTHIEMAHQVSGEVHMFPAIEGAVVAGFSAQANGSAVLSGVIPKSCASELAQDKQALIEHQIGLRPTLTRLLEGCRLGPTRTVGCFGHRLKRSFDNGILFLGDAARFVDPFTGEGIHHAFASAIYAAQVVTESLRKADTSIAALSEYEDQRGELNPRYLLCDIVQAIVTRPWLTKLVGERLRRRPQLASRLIGAITDVVPAQEAMTPGFVAQLLTA